MMITELPPGFTFEPFGLQIGKFEMKPGDVLVVKINEHISDDVSQRVREYVQRHVSDDVKILVLGGGIDLAVLTRSEIEARTA